MSVLDEYKNINSSFKKSSIFHVGIDAGFFSEFNYMIFYILYCLENHIEFKLYSKDANFGYKNGWKDYFEPFTDEVYEQYHSYLNRHPSGMSLKYILSCKSSTLLKWKIKNEFIIFCANLLKNFVFKNRFDYYTHNLFSHIEHKNKIYDNAFVSGDYIKSYNKVFDLLWRFNKSTHSRIEELIRGISLPDDYISCQIRGGDKYIEYDLLSIDIYLSKIKEVSSLKDVFVLTDDYRIIEQLQKNAPDYNWYTLCEKSQRGYYNTAFSKSDPLKKKEQMIRLFASVDLLCRSTIFVGTITATPSCVVGIRKYPNAYWVDFERGSFYDSIDYSIEYKNRLVKEYLANHG